MTTVAASIPPASAGILGEAQRPFTIAEYKNMVGRAGRLGYNERGQSFIIASTPLERQHLFRRYVLGQPEDPRSSFSSGSLATWVLRLLAQIARDIITSAISTSVTGAILFYPLIRASLARYCCFATLLAPPPS